MIINYAPIIEYIYLLNEKKINFYELHTKMHIAPLSYSHLDHKRFTEEKKRND